MKDSFSSKSFEDQGPMIICKTGYYLSHNTPPNPRTPVCSATPLQNLVSHIHGSSHVYRLYHFISFSIDKSWMLDFHSTWYFWNVFFFFGTTWPLISGNEKSDASIFWDLWFSLAEIFQHLRDIKCFCLQGEEWAKNAALFCCSKLTQWSTALLEKLIVCQLDKSGMVKHTYRKGRNTILQRRQWG